MGLLERFPILRYDEVHHHSGAASQRCLRALQQIGFVMEANYNTERLLRGKRGGNGGQLEVSNKYRKGGSNEGDFKPT
jgi:hypothetical protein